jgi:hypothetical protein
MARYYVSTRPQIRISSSLNQYEAQNHLDAVQRGKVVADTYSRNSDASIFVMFLLKLRMNCGLRRPNVFTHTVEHSLVNIVSLSEKGKHYHGYANLETCL